MGQPFVVENKPGAGGIPGTEQAKNAPPDGYTLTMCPSGPQTRESGAKAD